jgi:hypothetical protein
MEGVAPSTDDGHALWANCFPLGREVEGARPRASSTRPDPAPCCCDNHRWIHTRHRDVPTHGDRSPRRFQLTKRRHTERRAKTWDLRLTARTEPTLGHGRDRPSHRLSLRTLLGSASAPSRTRRRGRGGPQLPRRSPAQRDRAAARHLARGIKGYQAPVIGFVGAGAGAVVAHCVVGVEGRHDLSEQRWVRSPYGAISDSDGVAGGTVGDGRA